MWGENYLKVASEQAGITIQIPADRFPHTLKKFNEQDQSRSALQESEAVAADWVRASFEELTFGACEASAESDG